MAWDLSSLGGINSTVADCRTIFQFLLINGATCFILIHNHPTGELTPSMEDLKMTRDIIAGGKLINLRFHDHLIVSPDAFYSLRQAGLVSVD
jgi:DNA repair protein RadC